MLFVGQIERLWRVKSQFRAPVGDSKWEGKFRQVCCRVVFFHQEPRIISLTNRSKNRKDCCMKREILRLMVMVTLGGCFVSGCATKHYEPTVTTTPTGQVIVTEAPPPVRQEVVGTAPTTSHVWIQGYWMYRNGNWAWVPGHWEVRPRLNAAWVPGHWDQTSRGYAWNPGHWE
jgi:hypothetical protein